MSSLVAPETQSNVTLSREEPETQEILKILYEEANREFEELYQTKYRRNGRYATYLHYSCAQQDMFSEDPGFVLTDTVNQTWGFTSKLSEVCVFLGLTEEEQTALKADIYEIIQKEDFITNMKSDGNEHPYGRKFFVCYEH